MKKVLRKFRWKPLLILLGLGGVGVALAVFFWPRQPQPVAIDPREQWQAQQQVVSSVMQSADRNALIGSSPTLGAPDAEIILFEFSDFQCPYCARASLDVKILLDKYSDDVLFVYKHLPLTQIHPEAMPAARAAWAAGQQGQFWIYHDGLFAYQDRLGEALYVELGQQIGLDLEQFNRDRTSTASLTAIQRDLQLAQRLQLGGTPTFLINDLLMPPGAPLSFFEQTLDQIKEALAAREQPQ
ncbi:MAG: thioredoxin domain-containing protein [Cyanobacteria bacterium Co-bin13]|nr:thioredoxin domain-containing protein [Cyanobacteria bacterium Co-bin13]